MEWQLEELIITLISISLPSNEQTNIYGIGIASDEMIEDINSYFTLNKERFLQFGLLNKTEINEINRIEEELDLMLQELKEEDWFDISSNNRWKNCRLLARDILNKIGKGNLKLVVQHENEYDNEGNITIQKTKTRLE